MQLISTIKELRQCLKGKSDIAFVPTMGNLHEGHFDLVRIAREQGQCVVVSIFVNSLQFGANEDFGSYPRTLLEDCKQLEQRGVDVVFAPTEKELYPQPQQVIVTPPTEDDLCGAFRPGHFRGVATVVLKLFNIVQPQIAVFGKKDCQQLHVIKKMVEQLNLPVKIVGGETVRAADGLALSSRNQYLSKDELQEATYLHRTLVEMRQAIIDGASDFSALEEKATQALFARGWRAEYVAVRSRLTLRKPTDDESYLVILIAARLGKARLIDNIEVDKLT
jgi:pantoate--beta-alanine ligase